jgi:hypothetical protein
MKRQGEMEWVTTTKEKFAGRKENFTRANRIG